MGQVYAWILILAYSMEPYLWVRTMSVIPRQFRSRKIYIAAYAGYYSLTLLKQFSAYFHMNAEKKNNLTLCMLVYAVAMSVFLFKDKIFKRILVLGVFLFLVSSMEFVVFTVGVWSFRIQLEQLLRVSLSNCICAVASKLLVIPFLYFIWSKGPHQIEGFFRERKDFILIGLAVVLSFVGVTIVVSENQMENGKIIILILAIMQIVLLFNCYHFWLIVKNKEMQLKSAKEEITHMKDEINAATKLKQLEHDMGTHATIIGNLVHNKHYVELEEYVEHTFQDVKIAKNICTLSDHVISSAINNLIRIADEKKICFSRHIMMDEFYISSKDVCGIVSNMVKNAFEATEHLKNERRYVSLDIFPAEGGYKITCMNPFEYKVENLKTTKENKEKHGFGIGIIKELAERNGGAIEINLDDNNWFEISCFIPVDQNSIGN